MRFAWASPQHRQSIVHLHVGRTFSIWCLLARTSYKSSSFWLIETSFIVFLLWRRWLRLDWSGFHSDFNFRVRAVSRIVWGGWLSRIMISKVSIQYLWYGYMWILSVHRVMTTQVEGLLLCTVNYNNKSVDLCRINSSNTYVWYIHIFKPGDIFQYVLYPEIIMTW